MMPHVAFLQTEDLVSLSLDTSGGISQIEVLENKVDMTWHDYLQLAILYAAENANEQKIQDLLDQAFNADIEKSCAHIRFYLESRKDWHFLKNYGPLLREKVQIYKCN